MADSLSDKVNTLIDGTMIQNATLAVWEMGVCAPPYRTPFRIPQSSILVPDLMGHASPPLMPI